MIPVIRFALEHFRLNHSGAHGIGHWSNVVAHGVMLADHTPGVDLDVLGHFAYLHDCMRYDEGYDLEHGQRAGKLILRKRSDFELDDRQIDLLVEAVSKHALGGTSSDPTIGVCWDADRLDLPRVGIRPDARLMSTARGKELAA